MRVHHELKIQPKYFVAVAFGLKTFEIRSTEDRTFEVGDVVKLVEFEESGSTSASALVRILYITDYEQKDNYIVFSFKLVHVDFGDSEVPF